MYLLSPFQVRNAFVSATSWTYLEHTIWNAYTFTTSLIHKTQALAAALLNPSIYVKLFTVK